MLEVIKTWPNVAVIIVAMIGSAGLGGILKTWLGHKRGKRKDTDEVAMNLVGQLQARVKQLEVVSEKERLLCDAKLAVLRHRQNNLSSMFESLLMIHEIAPERVNQAIAHIRERRREQETTEAIEKAAIAGIATGGIDAEELATQAVGEAA